MLYFLFLFLHHIIMAYNNFFPQSFHYSSTCAFQIPHAVSLLTCFCRLKFEYYIRSFFFGPQSPTRGLYFILQWLSLEHRNFERVNFVIRAGLDFSKKQFESIGGRARRLAIRCWTAQRCTSFCHRLSLDTSLHIFMQR